MNGDKYSDNKIFVASCIKINLEITLQQFSR